MEFHCLRIMNDQRSLRFNSRSNVLLQSKKLADLQKLTKDTVQFNSFGSGSSKDTFQVPLPKESAPVGDGDVASTAPTIEELKRLSDEADVEGLGLGSKPVKKQPPKAKRTKSEVSKQEMDTMQEEVQSIVNGLGNFPAPNIVIDIGKSERKLSKRHKDWQDGHEYEFAQQASLMLKDLDILKQAIKPGTIYLTGTTATTRNKHAKDRVGWDTIRNAVVWK